jgi:hypothetical protein
MMTTPYGVPQPWATHPWALEPDNFGPPQVDASRLHQPSPSSARGQTATTGNWVLGPGSDVPWNSWQTGAQWDDEIVSDIEYFSHSSGSQTSSGEETDGDTWAQADDGSGWRSRVGSPCQDFSNEQPAEQPAVVPIVPVGEIICTEEAPLACAKRRKVQMKQTSARQRAIITPQAPICKPLCYSARATFMPLSGLQPPKDERGHTTPDASPKLCWNALVALVRQIESKVRADEDVVLCAVDVARILHAASGQSWTEQQLSTMQRPATLTKWADRERYGHLFLERGRGSRRQLSRHQGKHRCMDKWVNAGGKRAVVSVEVQRQPGLDEATTLERRMGKVELPGQASSAVSDATAATAAAPHGGSNLRYHRYVIAGVSAKAEMTLYHVFQGRGKGRALTSMAAASAAAAKVDTKKEKVHHESDKAQAVLV